MTQPHNSLTSHASLIVPPLRYCTPDRLQRAVDGLFDGTLTVVSLTHQAEGEIRGLVKNGDGCAYTVTLTPEGATCNCGDCTYRNTVCKHIVAVALSIPRPTPPQHSPMHLAWSNGEKLCKAAAHEPAWYWPKWNVGMLKWPETCPLCSAVYTRGYSRFWEQLTYATVA